MPRRRKCRNCQFLFWPAKRPGPVRDAHQAGACCSACHDALQAKRKRKRPGDAVKVITAEACHFCKPFDAANVPKARARDMCAECKRIAAAHLEADTSKSQEKAMVDYVAKEAEVLKKSSGAYADDESPAAEIAARARCGDSVGIGKPGEGGRGYSIGWRSGAPVMRQFR